MASLFGLFQPLSSVVLGEKKFHRFISDIFRNWCIQTKTCPVSWALQSLLATNLMIGLKMHRIGR